MTEAAKILEYQRKEKGAEGGRGRQDRAGDRMENRRLGQARSENRQGNNEVGTKATEAKSGEKPDRTGKGMLVRLKITTNVKTT